MKTGSIFLLVAACLAARPFFITNNKSHCWVGAFSSPTTIRTRRRHAPAFVYPKVLSTTRRYTVDLTPAAVITTSQLAPLCTANTTRRIVHKNKASFWAESASKISRLLPSLFLFLALGVTPLAIPSTCQASEWQLQNGPVFLPDRLELVIPNPTHAARSGTKQQQPSVRLWLSQPTLIGAGSGGSVFAFEQAATVPPSSMATPLKPPVLKISWKGSTASVHHECQILQVLQSYSIPSVEQCLGEFDYHDSDNNNNNNNDDDDEHRIMILLQPYMENSVASVSQLTPPLQRVAVQHIARTLIQCLAHNVVTIDVQPLLSPTTGDLLLIDMTEAQRLTLPFTFLDRALVGSFITEVLGLIPDDLAPLAATTMLEQLHLLQHQGIPVATDVEDLLFQQTLFFPDNDDE